jgi:hypothetical protein
MADWHSEFEKMGAFYLGREINPDTQERGALFLYDSRDLVTHGVAIGMTGSGKTGLCLAALEEAALDGLPVLAIDPKGDIGNLLLTFPELRAEDFRPWIHEDDARRKGMEPDAYAAAQASQWRDGLSAWGQDGERIQRLRDAAEIRLYTPGSDAGLPLSVLAALHCPDTDAPGTEGYAERIQTTVSSLLALVGLDLDPLTSPEHLLLSTLMDLAWRNHEDITVTGLISQIQHPPLDRLGVAPLDTVIPVKDRTALALRLNQLIAAPGFERWLNGEPLDLTRILYSEKGRPRIAIFSIAHLSDAERMFFVALLLNEVVSWMRTLSGTSSLRAILYMDEIFGYLPPTANPPSKRPFLTLLKQARAFGLGLLLATQNPVDLDYKALANIGSWFLGRLQTQRDKSRVLDGLESASAHGMDRKYLDSLLSRLPARTFLLNNVNDPRPLVFETRWVMSYLRGPLTRPEMQRLMAGLNATGPTAPPQADVRLSGDPGLSVKPDVPLSVNEFFAPLPLAAAPDDFIYRPFVLVQARLRFEDKKRGVLSESEAIVLASVDPERDDVDWAAEQEYDGELPSLSRKPVGGVRFATLPPTFARVGMYGSLRESFIQRMIQERSLTLLTSPSLNRTSEPGETAGEFRQRIAPIAREERDRRVAELRQRWAARLARESADVTRAQEALDRQQSRANSARWSSVAEVGSMVLGAIMGGRRPTARGMGSAGQRVGRTFTQGQEVGRAAERLEKEQRDLQEVTDEYERAVEEIERSLDPLTEEFVTTEVRLQKKDVSIITIGLAWVPTAWSNPAKVQKQEPS